MPIERLDAPTIDRPARRKFDTATPPMTLWLRLPAAYVPQIVAQARERAIQVDQYALRLLCAALLAETEHAQPEAPAEAEAAD